MKPGAEYVHAIDRTFLELMHQPAGVAPELGPPAWTPDDDASACPRPLQHGLREVQRQVLDDLNGLQQAGTQEDRRPASVLILQQHFAAEFQRQRVQPFRSSSPSTTTVCTREGSFRRPTQWSTLGTGSRRSR
jgi:hypothetical protein